MIRLHNVDKVQAQLKAMPVKALMALKVAERQEAEKIRTKALRLVPVDSANLKLSITVTKPKIRGTTVTTFVGAGGAAQAYALAVHETPSQYDPPTWVGKQVKFRIGGPKFIEKPTHEAEKGYGRRLWRTIQRELV